MAYTKGTLEHGSDVLLPKTTLDQLYTSDGSTAIAGSTNTIKQDYLPVSGEELGIVKVNTEWDTYGVHLVINAGTVSVAGKYASASQFGVVKVSTTASNGVSLAISNGTVSASAQYASSNMFGVVMVPGGSTNGVALNISDGMLYASGVLAQSNAFGVVKAGNYVTINDGVLSVNLADTDAGGGTAGAVYINPTNGGRGISLSISSGELNVLVNAANKNGFGTVKIGDNIDVTYDDGVHEDGIISVPLAGTATAGVVLLASSIGTSTTKVVTEVLVKNAVDNLQGQISSITGTTVSDLQNQISAITGTTVANLQGQINDITGTTVSNLQGQIDSITGTTVAALQGQITDITGTTVADLQNQINGKQNTLSAGAGIEINGTMISTTSVMKIMTTAQRTAITPEAGQVIYDSTLGQLFLGDGFTPGGTIIGAGGGGGSVTPGYRLTDDGTYLNFNPVQTIVDTTGSNTITLNPDTAYKIIATGGAVTLNANAPAAGSWGYEGHAEIFVAGTGYIVTGANVVLANALEPDAVNNCVLRFHDGTCIIDVEDHVYGYIVTSISGTTQGTLPYGITSATSNYIAFDATTNGSTIDLSGSTASTEKHVVGNGYTETTLTGAVDCSTNKVTVANLALSDVQITGGTMTLGDAYIPSGSTVAVSGGGLAVEKVTGNGGVIDLGGTSISESYANISGCTITNGLGGYGVVNVGSGNIVNAAIVGNSATQNYGGGLLVSNAAGTASAFVSSCVFSGNIVNSGAGNGGGITLTVNAAATIVDTTLIDNNALSDLYIDRGAVANVSGGCTIGSAAFTGSNGIINFYGSNTVTISITPRNASTSGTVTLTSAILDLTGNTNATPIAPGGGITFEAGGATILYGDSAGVPTSSAFIAGATVGALGNNGVIVPLSGGYIYNGTYSGITISSATYGFRTSVTFNDCIFSGAYWVGNGGGAELNGSATLSGTIKLVNSGFIYGARNLGKVTITSGAVVDASAYTWASYSPVNAVGTLVIESGAKWKADNSEPFELTAGTYISAGIKKDGTILGTRQEE